MTEERTKDLSPSDAEHADVPTLLVTVGTDHHQFNRLIEWVDRWLAEGGTGLVRPVIQYGTSRAPKSSGNGDASDRHQQYLDHERLQRAFLDADIVVSHGGPATISEARRTGHLPIVVPRDPAAGEHVDDHQLRFTARLSEESLVVRCTTERDMHEALDAAAGNPESVRLPRPDDIARDTTVISASVRRAGTLIDDLLRDGARGNASAATQASSPTQASSATRMITSTRQSREQWPPVSVVIPTKERPQLLREAVASIRAQDYPGDIRCLVVFDGTQPDDALIDEDQRRQVTVLTNGRTAGLAGARNSGILMADGELIAFCDDDDAWLPGKLRAQLEALDDAPEAALACCGIRVGHDGTNTDRSLERERITRRDLLLSRLTELHPSTFLFRRDVLVERIGLVDESLPGSYGEDYELLLRAAGYGPVVNLPAVHVRVRWHGDTHHSHFASRWDTIARALTLLLDRHPEFRTAPRGYGRVAGQIAFARAALGERRVALRWIWRTLRASPSEARAFLAFAVVLGVIHPSTVLRTLHRRGRGL